MNYKIGDKVRVKANIPLGYDNLDRVEFLPEMAELCGKEYEVADIDSSDGTMRLSTESDLPGGEYWWIEEWIEPASNCDKSRYNVGDKVRVEIPETDATGWGEKVNHKVFRVLAIESDGYDVSYILDDRVGFHYSERWLKPIENAPANFKTSIKVKPRRKKKDTFFPYISNGVAKMPEDDVDHPEHYAHGKIECIDAMESAYGKEAVIHFCLCNAMKYLWRCEHKGSKKKDLEKAIWYIDRALKTTDKA